METKQSTKKNEQLAVTPVIGSPKFIPILFSTSMVQAILCGDKTQTRRIIKKKYSNTDIEWKIDKYGKRLVERQNDVPAPKVVESEDGKTTTTRHITLFAEIKQPYKKGDILWARETFRSIEQEVGKPRHEYKATEKINLIDKWKPSLFMPKEACRIFLKVKSIGVERLQEISNDDIIKEGVRIPVSNKSEGNNKVVFELGKDNSALSFLPDGCMASAAPKLNQNQLLNAFWAELWCKVNGRESWNSNPFVWVIEFERIERPTGFL